MSFLRGTEDYYRKFIELQEKLRKSEEERLRLEMRFNEMIQFTRDEEEAHHRKLQTQYQNFLEEDIKRQERNERIVKVLERIENRAALLAAKTERFKLFRKQYTSYLKSMTGDVHYHPVELPYEHLEKDYDHLKKDYDHLERDYDHLKKDYDQLGRDYDHLDDHYDLKKHNPNKTNYSTTNLSTSSISKRYNFETPQSISPIKSKISERLSVLPENDPINYRKYQNGDLYNHPTIQKALNGSQRSLNDDLESLKSYLKSQSPIKEKSVLNEDLLDTDLSDSDREDLSQSPSIKLKTSNPRIDRIIKWRPKFQLPRKNKFQLRKNRWNIPERVNKTYSSPRKESKSPLASPSFRKRHVEASRSPDNHRYEDTRRDFGYKPAPSVDMSEDFRPSSRNYSTSPTRNYQSEDLGYQLANYPSLDVGTRINIEYTLYPKISDRSYYPLSTSSSYLNYRDRRSPSPGGSRVSWYDHYLGRCPPSTSTFDKNFHDYTKHKENFRDFSGEDYRSLKDKQDSILLNSDIRNTKYSDYKKHTPSFQTKKVEFMDNKNNYKENEDNLTKNQMEENENITQYEDLPKSDVDETEDQILSEVFHEDVETTKKSLNQDHQELTKHKEVNFDHNEDKSDKNKELENIENKEEEDLKEDIDFKEDINVTSKNNNEFYEEKHDSLEEIQKENMVQEKNYETDKKEDDLSVEKDGNNDNLNLEDNIEAKDKENLDKLKEEGSFEKESKLEERKETFTIDEDQLQLNKDDKNLENIPVKTEIIKDSELIENNISNEKITSDDQIKEITKNQQEENKITEQPEDNIIPKDTQQESQHQNDNQPLTTQLESSEYQPNEQETIQYDENGQPIQYTNYDQGNVQFDENGQPIGYGDGQYYPQYDENGQPIVQYDENGQPISQYDENGQPISQYDENGQPISQYGEGQSQYDENGQPIVQYDENGQPIVQYDENGQPLYQYDQYYQNQQYQEGQEQYQQGDGQYQEGKEQYEQGQEQYQGEQQYQEGEQPYQEGKEQYQQGQEQYQEGDQQYQEGEQPYQEGKEQHQQGQEQYQGDQQYQEGEQSYQEGNQQNQEGEQENQSGNNIEGNTEQYKENLEQQDKNQEYQKVSTGENEQYEENKQVQEDLKNNEDTKMNVLEMLDTDSESTKQETKKSSNESDFDLSNK